MSNRTTEIWNGLQSSKKSGRYKVGPKENRTADNIVFDSEHEMRDYLNFKSLLRCGALKRLKLQVKFALHAIDRKGQRKIVSHYIADFVVVDRENRIGIYDSKGHATAEYKRSKKWFEHQYFPLRIVEL